MSSLRDSNSTKGFDVLDRITPVVQDLPQCALGRLLSAARERLPPTSIRYNNPDLHSGLYSADFRRTRKEGFDDQTDHAPDYPRKSQKRSEALAQGFACRRSESTGALCSRLFERSIHSRAT